MGPYQPQAAIAAVHAEATRAEETDWPQIVGLYRLLELAGDHAAAGSSHRTAARRTTSLPERRYLEARAARLTGHRSGS